MRTIATLFPATLVVIPGFILLQIYLSKKGNKWLGLILPVIFFCIAAAGSGYQIYEWSLTNYENPNVSVFGWVGEATAYFFTYNIPTVILLLIYFFSRRKHRHKKALDKMNLQDL